jgi:hypothetical protein
MVPSSEPSSARVSGRFSELASGLVQKANFVLQTPKIIVAFELQRALLYSRLVLDQRGHQVKSRASYKVSSFLLWRLLDDRNSDPAATNTRVLPSRSGLLRARAPGRAEGGG